MKVPAEQKHQLVRWLYGDEINPPKPPPTPRIDDMQIGKRRNQFRRQSSRTFHPFGYCPATTTPLI